MQVFNIDVVYYNYCGLVCSIVKKYIKNRSDVEECVSDIFLKAHLQNERYNAEKGSLKSWLGTISRNHCIDVLRKQKKQLYYVDAEFFRYNYIVEETYDYSLDVLVDVCLSLANEDEMRLIQLFYFENKKHREIAELMGVSTNAVGTMIKRSTTRIAKRVAVPVSEYKMAS